MTHQQPPPRDPSPGYFGRLLLALDRLANSALGGDDRQTISERARDWRGWVARNILRHFCHDDRERTPASAPPSSVPRPAEGSGGVGEAEPPQAPQPNPEKAESMTGPRPWRALGEDFSLGGAIYPLPPPSSGAPPGKQPPWPRP